jgi:hypothetical protein
MDVGVTLKLSESTHVDYQWAGAYRMRVEASDPVGFDGALFLFDRKPLNPHTGKQDDVFIGVAGPVELADYPEGGPNGETPFPFFRLNYFEIDVDTAELAERVWTDTLARATAVLLAVKKLARLEPVVTTRIGSPSGSTSVSQSTSASQSS